jgi:ABC-type nitrate/sulfonate/bicarbonate transport system permease component
MNKNYLEIGLIYEKSIFERFKHIYFQYGLESLFTTLRLSIAIGWIVIYVAEYGSATIGRGGLGYFIAHNRQMGNVEEQFAGVIILATLSFIMDYIVRRVQKRCLKWQNKEGTL